MINNCYQHHKTGHNFYKLKLKEFWFIVCDCKLGWRWNNVMWKGKINGENIWWWFDD
jgi:hypothetical protein